MAKKINQKLNTKNISRKYKKHFLLYNNGGVISATTPKDWARANQLFFKDYNFTDSKNTPSDTLIEKKLQELGFRIINNNEIIIYYNYNTL